MLRDFVGAWNKGDGNGHKLPWGNIFTAIETLEADDTANAIDNDLWKEGFEAGRKASQTALREKVDHIHAEVYSVWNGAKGRLSALELNHLETALKVGSELLDALAAKRSSESE